MTTLTTLVAGLIAYAVALVLVLLALVGISATVWVLTIITEWTNLPRQQ